MSAVEAFFASKLRPIRETPTTILLIFKAFQYTSQDVSLYGHMRVQQKGVLLLCWVLTTFDGTQIPVLATIFVKVCYVKLVGEGRMRRVFGAAL